jgi:hypothetical protein
MCASIARCQAENTTVACTAAVVVAVRGAETEQGKEVPMTETTGIVITIEQATAETGMTEVGIDVTRADKTEGDHLTAEKETAGIKTIMNATTERLTDTGGAEAEAHQGYESIAVNVSCLLLIIEPSMHSAST